MSRRGQTYALEGVIAALVIVTGLLFAMQAVTVTPGSGGSQQATTSQQALAADTLDTARRSGTLTRAIRFWNPDEEAFHCSPSDATYYQGAKTDSSCSSPDADYMPPNEFGRLLNQTFGSGGVNVHVRYQTTDGIERQPLVDRGEPGSGAVTAVTTVTLSDDDPLYDVNGDPTGETVRSGSFYAPDDGDEQLYNVVQVELVVWQR